MFFYITSTGQGIMKFLNYIPVFLLCVFFLHTMDLSILHLTSAMIYDDFGEQKKNYFDKLPLELHGKIVKNIFDLVVHKDEYGKKYINQKESEYIPNMSLFLGIKLAHEFSQFQKICQYKIGFKEFNACQLFVLSRQERDLFMRIANPPLFLDGDISADDYKILVRMSNDIKKGLYLTVDHSRPTLHCIRNVSILGIFLGIPSFLVMLNIPIKYIKKYNWLWSYGFLGSSVTSYLCLITFFLSDLSLGPRYGSNGYLKDVQL